MAFYGYEFSFDGVPSFEYGLIVYDFNNQNEDGGFASTPSSILEDRTSNRFRSIYYGSVVNDPLTFSFTFGVDSKGIEKDEYLDRWEMDVIANWLTGKDGYRYLEIMQPDMEAVRYRCIITDLRYSTFGKAPWAFTCTVTCDSPYAYLYPEEKLYTVSEEMHTRYFCRASSRYYYPKLEITMQDGSSVSIVNHSDGDREFRLDGIPEGRPVTITVDNENEILQSSSGLNLYDCFNFNFFRLIRGNNDITITTEQATVSIVSEFPINIGG